MTTATLTRIRESVTCDKPLRIDRKNGVIHNVKILGRESMNGRTYSERALREAKTFYEGIKVNVDHPDRNNPNQERSFTSFIGQLDCCRVTESGVYGDLNILKSSSQSESVFEAAERFPKQFGLSHNAEGELVQKDGSWVVESIDCVHSVDIVSQPATNAGLFESVGHGQSRRGRRYPKTISLREAKRVMRRSGCVVPSLELLFEAMDDGLLDPTTSVEIPDEAKEEFEDAAEMSMEDNADSLALQFAPDKLQEVKAAVITMLAKKSTDGKRTASDIAAINDFIDGGIQMLEKMFPEDLGNQPKQAEGNQPGGPGIPESFVNRLRGWTPSEDPKEFSARVRKPPVVTASEARRERIVESRLQSQQSRDWTPAKDSKEFARRIRKV